VVSPRSSDVSRPRQDRVTLICALVLALGWIVFAYIIELNLGLAVFAVASGLGLAGLLWWNARALRREHEHFLMLTRATQDPVWDWNLGADSVWLSENTERVFGWTTGELADRQWIRDRIHPAELGRVLASFAAAAGSGASTWTCEYRFRCRDGRYRDVLQRALLLRDHEGRPVRMLGTMLDLTERIAIERTLRERTSELEHSNARLAAAERRFRQVFEGTASGMLIVSPDGDISMVNQAAGELFGYELEELVTLPIDCVLPPDLDELDRPGSDELDVEPERRRVLGYHKDGHRVPVELVLSPIEGDDGVMTIASVSDLTARRAAEISLRERSEETEHANAELARANAELARANAELARANAELARANAELERFAQVASHDLQEPLRTVSSFVQLLAKRYGGNLDENGRRYVAYAVDGAERMRALINALLAYSLVERQEAPIDAEVALARVLPRVLADLHAAVTTCRAEITHDELPVIAGHEGQLAQLLLNLVSNAIKYRRGEAPRIHLGAVEEPDHWRLSVADNGIGIEPRYFDRIFVVFQRLHTREAYEGTGVGLAICKRIVERHGGRIWVESRPGQGTTFFFTMRKPAAPSDGDAALASAAAAAAHDAALAAADLHTRRVEALEHLASLERHALPGADRDRSSDPPGERSERRDASNRAKTNPPPS
jgi:PAS domain S-box-containing protein